MKKGELYFCPLGGVGEIGMNLALYGYATEDNEDHWIMVDCGVTFPGPELPGVDLVLPDISFCQQLGPKLKAIIITHAHEDHYGALLTLAPILKKPIYCTPFCEGMLEAKAAWERNAPKLETQTFRAGDTFKIGPFEIEPVHVTHSIPEPVSLAIRTPAGQIIHTGDWKIDSDPTLGAPTDEKNFRRLGRDGVLALICDSTNAVRDGVSPSEREVSDSLAELIHQSTGRVAITTFSSNVGRIRSIAMAAKKADRRVLLMGSSIRRVVDVATGLGMFDDMDEFLDLEDYASTPRNKIVLILTGSQGENRAALAKISRGEHHTVELAAGDRVIYSSRSIPGNEKPINDTKNMLIEQGVEIITDSESLVHVSGHPRRSELKTMYEWVNPQIAIPVHGEAAHLAAHARLAGEWGVPQVMPIRNGDMVRLAPGPAEIVDTIEAGRIYKDGKIIGDEEEVGVVERRKLAYNGVISMSVILEKTGKIADEIDMELYGIPEVTQDGDYFEDVIYDAAEQAVLSIPIKRRKDLGLIHQAMFKAVRSAVKYHWGKKPKIMIFVSRV